MLRMNRLAYRCPIITVAILASGVALGADAQKAGPPQAGVQSPVHVEMQAWQIRRAAYQALSLRLRKGDFSAGKDFDAVLTEFDTRLFSRTPIEELEILGDFYIPKGGPDPALLVVVQNLVLGWYDALRFGSESGRVEIINNEGFFKKAFVQGGPEVTSKAVKFLKENPERVRALVAQGIAIAEKYRETTNYDRHWPTAYGLERMMGAQGGSCAAPPELPRDQWNKAWEEAKHRVSLYFEPAAPT
jgi:hypothetical protein